MTEAHQVLVDTNILVDVTNGTGEWAAWSREMVADFQGGVFINPIVYSELCVPLESTEEAEELIATLRLG